MGSLMLPNFLIVGAQKAGTTSLWHYLRTHREVFLPDNKEPGYFAEEFGWHNGISWYETFFSGADHCRAIGEASTYYTMYPYFKGVPRRIASVLPDVRLIYIMRDPIERMRSCYVQLLTDGQERRPMREALFLDPGYVLLTRYAMQISQYFDYFDESQILLMTAEELRFRRVESIKRVLSFLEIGEDPHMDIFSEENQSSGKRAPRASGRLLMKVADSERLPSRIRHRARGLLPLGVMSRAMLEKDTDLDDDLRRRLIDLVLPDVAELRRWMGPVFDGWGLLEPERPTLAAS
jgi:hypothetical protein